MKLLLSVLIAVFIYPAISSSRITLNPVFSNHMVLQHGQPVPIWGDASPGESVHVSFRDQRLTAIADQQGKWRIEFASLQPGGPDSLHINRHKIKEVWVGEVWLGSGQSNMEGITRAYARKDPNLKKLMLDAPYPSVHLFKSDSDGWTKAEMDEVGSFSALMFAFGIELHQQQNMPVGVMVAAASGSTAGQWIAKDMLHTNTACRERYNAVRDRLRREHTSSPEKSTKPFHEIPFDQLKSGNLFEAHVRPLVGYGIRGVLWDQGESGTNFIELSQQVLMPALITGWRKAWGQGAFPFLFMQKPSGGGCAWIDGADGASPFTALPAVLRPAEHIAGIYRTEYASITEVPHTAMVTTRDLSPGMHPLYKSRYGQRAAQVAQGFVYKEDVIHQGPMYAKHEIVGPAIRVWFKHVGSGLTARHAEKLQGFAIAGDDRVFHWAKTTIRGDSIFVYHPDVPKPLAVRYAWSDVVSWANLFNKDGLPALAFRTDSW